MICFYWRDGKMSKDEIYNYLLEKKIWHKILEHQAVYTMKDLKKLELLDLKGEAKNLFLKDDKNNFYLIVVKGDKRVDLKQFRKNNNLRSLSFASEKNLLDIIGLKPGTVSPLGILNDKMKRVIVYIDKYFIDNNIILVHPNDNTATVWLKTEDLVDIIKNHGNSVNIVEI